ncbi:MBL fold metallo-hydrolase [Georgenia sp. Z1491]|uniref:MBL fold metallo-hydrolase n=1 Tax=Georgenia sp. Z1491 TaxID=3416707 RepID=UPI003CF3172D
MYDLEPVVDGFPGKSSTHGAVGWSSVHLLRGEGRVVLVETGPPAYAPLLAAGLERLGLGPGDVTDVLLTHSHWDHLANFPTFESARVWIGGRELAWAEGLPVGTPHQSSLHVAALTVRRGGLGLVSDGDEACAGIEVLDVPGHTPGHVAFCVETGGGPVIFAGDSVKNVYELTTGEVDMTLDAEASRASIERLRSRMTDNDATLVPGHDVPLRLEGGRVVRVRPQGAQVTFFASAAGPEDRSISDLPDG